MHSSATRKNEGGGGNSSTYMAIIFFCGAIQTEMEITNNGTDFHGPALGISPAKTFTFTEQGIFCTDSSTEVWLQPRLIQPWLKPRFHLTMQDTLTHRAERLYP